MDRKQIVISTAASLGVVAVGFFVWRYQQGVSADQAQQNMDAEQAHIDSMNSAIQSLQQGIGSYVPQYGNGASGSSVPDTGSTSLQTPADQSSDLKDILNAFFGDSSKSNPNGVIKPSGVNTGEIVGLPNTPTYNPIQIASGTSLASGKAGSILYPTSTLTLRPPATGKLYA